MKSTNKKETVSPDQVAVALAWRLTDKTIAREIREGDLREFSRRFCGPFSTYPELGLIALVAILERVAPGVGESVRLFLCEKTPLDMALFSLGVPATPELAIDGHYLARFDRKYLEVKNARRLR